MIMTSNPHYENNGSPLLHMPEKPSKFPLSSPVSDDQISRRSFESKRTDPSSGQASSAQSSPDPFGDTESGNTSGQDEFHLERYSESSSWTKRDPPKHRPEDTSRNSPISLDRSVEKKKRPGLNIVTDFSRGVKQALVENPTIKEVPVRRPGFGDESSAAAPESQTSIRKLLCEGRQGAHGFVNLSDLEGLRKDKRSTIRPRMSKGAKKDRTKRQRAGRQTQAGQGRDHVGNGNTLHDLSLGAVSRNGPVMPSKRDRDNNPYHLQPPEREINEVSPTARSVVIGISIPSTEVEAHKPNDEASSALTLQTPITPTIVVTPADATVGWSRSTLQGPAMRRPSLSVYSQATGTVYRQNTNAPPVPALPDHHKQFPVPAPEQPRRSTDTREAESPQDKRPLSTETIIYGDDLQRTERQPLSSGSKDEIFPSTCDTGRPRSKGWWNLMLSPMLSRVGTNASKNTASPVEDAPNLPSLSTTTEKGLGLDDKSPTTTMSLNTPRRAGLENTTNSTWSNLTQWERDREQALSSRASWDDAVDAESSRLGHSELGQCVQATVEAPMKKLGLAAEYYQACDFDVLNHVPYFECVNHDCATALPKLGNFTDARMVPKDSDNALDVRSRTLMNQDVAGPSSPTRESRLRSDSDSTIIEDEPIELSPHVRKADARPILKATQPQKVDASQKHDLDEKGEARAVAATAEKARSATPPPYSPSPAKTSVPRYVGVMPPRSQFVPSTPGPISPQAQTAMNPNGGIFMAQIHRPAPAFINFNPTSSANLPPRPSAAPISLSDIENPVEVRRKAEVRRRHLEQEDAVARRAGGLWRGRGCFPQNGCFGRGGSAGRTRRRWYIATAIAFVLMITLIVVLATQLTRRGNQTPVQSRWLNLTGYPPMPTGISTIARPDIASAVTACVQPSSFWSCALPREDQARISPNGADQPNFRLEITFRNGTVNANGTVPVLDTRNKRTIASQRAALLSRQNDPFTNSLFEPNPAPPGLAEQTFLGNTTDNISVPFSGEDTPFFITFLPSDPSVPESFNNTGAQSRRRLRRQAGSSSDVIPSPAILPDGTAAPANLLPHNPLPYSQPVKLYDRGLGTEHYGFYTYFDRSIFLKTTAQFGSSSSQRNSGNENDADNSNGGASKQDANLRCTWAQTRFLVQLWTNPNFGGQLLPSVNGSGTSSGPANGLPGDQADSGTSSATDFSRPGSFPYAVTLTLDRHGGDSSKKGVYCYGMDGQQKIVVDDKKLVAEVRGAGGRSINRAPGIFSNAAGNDGFDPMAGGIDGGTGGCGCEWRNWARNGGQ
jgi:hypothetical protein